MVLKKRSGKHAYRGYKGVGLTFLADGTDDVSLHSRRKGMVTKARMQYGHAWAIGQRQEPAVLVEDSRPSPIDKVERGTYISVQFSRAHASQEPCAFGGNNCDLGSASGTKTAVGQILLGRDPVVELKVTLRVVTDSATEERDITPRFLYPHDVARNPPFRFLDLVDYYSSHSEQSSPAPDKIRQDGLYFIWDAARIQKQLTEAQQKAFEEQLKQHTPHLYAFLPYQGSLWADINEQTTGVKNRNYLYPGLVVGINRQRLADTFDYTPTRFETFSRNAFIVVHFDEAKPDQGRKTLQEEVLSLAQVAADRAVQYLARQRDFLRPPGNRLHPTSGRSRKITKTGYSMFEPTLKILPY